VFASSCFKENLLTKCPQGFIVRDNNVPIVPLHCACRRLRSSLAVPQPTIYIEQFVRQFLAILAPPQCSLRGPVGDSRRRFVVTLHPSVNMGEIKSPSILKSLKMSLNIFCKTEKLNKIVHLILKHPKLLFCLKN
jgi:hypothetical protein